MQLIKKYLTADALFFILLLVVVCPIWLFDGFITGDGPCHVYNAGILADFWWGNPEFYQQYYEPLINTNPNWSSHFLLAVLQQVFSGAVADKLVITLCVLLFTTGFRYLVHAINNQQKGYAIWGLILVWQLAMFMGFYNYMLSIGLFFYLSGYWLKNREQMNGQRLLLVSLATVVLYFSHLMGLFFLWLVLLVMLLQMIIQKNGGYKSFAIRAGVSQLPAFVFTILYIARNYSRTDNVAKESIDQLWWNLKSVSSLQSLTAFEWQLADIFFVTASILFVISIYRIIKGVGHKQWVLPSVFLVLLLVYYFMGYESLFGGSYIRQRIEILIFTFLILLAASVQIPKLIYWLSTTVAIVLVVWFSVLRIPAYSQYNEISTAFKKAGEQLEDKSVVLPVRFIYSPVYTDGEQMARKVALFSHIGETIAPEKQLIFMNNYEADTKYFPLVWKEEVNPYSHLSVGYSWGHEAVPPKMNLTNYNENYLNVDYVITWQFRDYMPGVDTTAKAVMADIEQHYTLKYEDEQHEIRVYELNKREK